MIKVHEIFVQVAIQAMLIRCSSITIEKYGTKPHKTEVAGKGQTFLSIEENLTKRVHTTGLDLLKITFAENRTAIGGQDRPNVTEYQQ